MTRRLFGIVVTFASALLLTACKNDVANAGSSVLDDGDVILVKADTFALSSGIVDCDYILSSPDSFLLGEIESDYGVLRADILTQLACPTGYSYPENAEIDSICMFLYYQAWEGSGDMPLSIDVYEIDRQALAYSPVRPYHTDIDIDTYCSLDDTTRLLYNEHLVVGKEMIDSVYSSNTGGYIPMVRCRLTEDFVRRFSQMRRYTDQESFNEFFKGLYITSTFGSSTVLNITDISLGVYYHFSYRKNGAEQDTTVTDMKGFYANAEVRQINRFEYQDKEELLTRLAQDSSTHNYIIAPAGVYTRMSFPMQEMKEVITGSLEYNGQQKRPYVNLAQLRVNVQNVFSGATSDMTRNDWLQPASYMLLIKQDSEERFFRNKELPSDTVAILSALTSGVDSEGNTIYYYSYDLSTLLTNQLRQEDNPETLQMLLVPVSVETSSSSSSSSTSIVSIKQSQTLSATQISSANNSEAPMSLNVVYSGF